MAEVCCLITKFVGNFQLFSVPDVLFNSIAICIIFFMCVLWPRMRYVLVNAPCELEKNVYLLSNNGQSAL